MQAPQESTGSSITKEATTPLRVLLGGTELRLARPPPRLTRQLSSGPLPCQSMSPGSAAGKERSTCAVSPMLTFLGMNLPKRHSA